MFKPQPQCKVCSVILSGDTDLKRRIFNSTKFLGASGNESLAAINRSYGNTWSTVSMGNHVKKHQFLTKQDVARMHLAKKPADITIPPQPASEIVPTAPTAPDDVFGEVMSQGLEALKSGELKMTTRDVLAAAKNKADLDLKRKDQNIKMQEMIWHFASGEAANAGNYDRKIIEGETATAYDAAAITADNLTPEQE
jgi:hypothetical protein